LSYRHWFFGAVVVIVGLLLNAVVMAGQNIKLAELPNDIVLMRQDRSGVEIEVTTGAIDFYEVKTKEGIYELLTADHLVRSQREGEPNLPTANRLLAVPFGAELQATVTSFETMEIDLADYGITLPLMPVQPSLSKSDDPELVPFVIDRNLYGRDEYYQPGLVRTEDMGIMRSMRLGLVVVAPFAYNPVSNKLKIYTRISVKVDFIGADWEQTRLMQEKFYSPAFEPAFSHLENYESFKEQSLILDDITRYPLKMVIVSHRMFQSQLQPFIAWKIKRGFKVVVGYTDSIGTTNTAIKSFIQNIYNQGTPQDPAPSFVLLVGDAQQIPPFQFSGHISDLSFCEYTGDNVPEIYYGRFSAQNTTELQPQIDKTLEYERYQMADPSFLGNVTMIAGVDATYAPTYGNGQINYGTNYYFNAAHGIYSNTWLYPASGQPGAAEAIRQTVNSGVGVINYTAHGSHSEWSNPQFSSSQVQALTNAGKYPLAIGNCCLTNTFGTDYSTPCVGEVWLQSANKGAIGYIGGSNSTYWDEDYWWGVGAEPVSSNPIYQANKPGAYDGLFHDRGEPLRWNYIYNDAIIFCGNLAVMQAGSTRIAYYWQIYHLMGDPSVMTYLRVPSTNPVSHASTVLINATTFTVSAAPYSYVGLSFNGVLHGAAFVDSTGTVNVPITPFGVPGTVDIVVTAQNRIPYISTIQSISPSGPYVVLDSYFINDSLGNNNGLIDIGENIRLGVQLKNVGPDNAYNVTATLLETDPFVTVTDNSETYGTINGNNGVVNRTNAFAFSAAGNTPDGHVIPFQISVSGNALDIWNSNLNLTVHAPTLGFVGVQVADQSVTPNGILDPGESAYLTVTLSNSGSAAAGNVAAILSVADPYITVSDNSGTFGNIASGGSANNTADRFLVSASPNCPQGYSVTCNLAVTGNGGYSANLNFNLVVGDRVVFFSDDFSTNLGWTGLGGAGEWTIGPATGGSGSDSFGGPDPAQDHSPSSDNRLLGNDLTSGTGGDYNPNISSPAYVTSPIIDCSNYRSVQLKFYRWLGVERNTFDHARLEAYNGTNWIQLFENGSNHIDETAWSEQNYDLSAIADNNPNFRIRFSIGPTDGSWQYCGWNIDDITLKGYQQGQATYPNMVYLPGSFADSMVQGETATWYLLVINNGNAALRATFSSSVAWVNVSESLQTIQAGDSLVFPINVNSSSLGTPGLHSGNLSFSCNDPDMPSGNIPVSLYIYAPSISIAPLAITDTLLSGEQSQKAMIISNGGPGRLNFSAEALTNDRLRRVIRSSAAAMETGVVETAARPDDFSILDQDKGGTLEPVYPPVIASQGGPDQFGHRWIDSDEPGGPVFNWVDISGSGTRVVLTDDSYAGPFNIGFSFPFFENSYAQLYIGSNGIITFGSGSSSLSNTGIPNSSAPNNMIAMWWDDLNPGAYGNVYYYFDSPNSRFIVSFDSIPNYISGGGTGALSFQAVLYSNGRIILNYARMNPGTDTDSLRGATIGIENSAGNDGLQICYNANYMHNQLAIKISAGTWLAIDPVSGSLAPSTSDTLIVSIDAGDLDDGEYTGQIMVTCNDPLHGSINIPVGLWVGDFGPAGCRYIPGDINGDGNVQGSDVTFGVRYFKGLSSMPPPDSCFDDSMGVWIYAAGDVNGSCEFRGSDITMLVSFFKNYVSQLTYCHRTPPLPPLRLPAGWIWDKEGGAIRIEKGVESESAIYRKSE